MGDVAREFNNAVSSVSNTVNRELSNAGNSVNREGANATDSLARSDVGRVAGVALAPVTAGVRATEMAAQGNFSGAATTASAGLISNSQPLLQLTQVSPDVNRAFRDPNLNKYTLGYFSDSANVGDITMRAGQDGVYTAQDEKILASYGAKNAVLAGGLYAGATAYGWAAANPAKATLASTIGDKLAKGDLKGVAQELGLPGFVADIFPGEGSPDKSPLPNNSDPLGGTVTPSSGSGGNIAMVAVGAIAAVGIAYYFAKK